MVYKVIQSVIRDIDDNDKYQKGLVLIHNITKDREEVYYGFGRKQIKEMVEHMIVMHGVMLLPREDEGIIIEDKN